MYLISGWQFTRTLHLKDPVGHRWWVIESLWIEWIKDDQQVQHWGRISTQRKDNGRSIGTTYWKSRWSRGLGKLAENVKLICICRSTSWFRNAATISLRDNTIYNALEGWRDCSVCLSCCVPGNVNSECNHEAMCRIQNHFSSIGMWFTALFPRRLSFELMMMNERMDGNNKCWNVSLYTAISLNMLIIDIEIVRIPFRYGLNFKQRCGWYEFLNFNAEGIIDS